MPNMLGLQISGVRLALRVVLAVVIGGLAFVLFYYVPSHLLDLIDRFLPPGSQSVVSGIVSNLISPTLPTIGLALSAFVFLGIILRGTKVYGPILVLNGLSFLAYIYTALHGGTVGLTLPSDLLQGVSGGVTVDLSTLMLIMLLPSLLTIVKGAVLTVSRPRTE